MEFGGKLGRIVFALVVFVSTALLVFFGNGLMPHWPLMWVAPVPVMLFALRRPAWQGGLMAVVAWMAGCLNLWSYLHVLGRLPIVWFIDCGLGAVVLAIGILLMRVLVRHGAIWSAWIALPAVWVTFEYVRNLTWPHGSAGCIAYSQLNFLPFLQFASIAGPWGMGFVLMLFASGLALGIHLWPSAKKQSIAVAGTTFGIVVAILISGVVRLAIPQSGPEMKVGLVTSDAAGILFVNTPGAPTEKVFERYAEQARTLIARGAEIVVMPEGIGVVTNTDAARADAIFQAVANQTGTVLVVGVSHVEGKLQYDEARIYAPGAAVRSYDKEHLLPPFEDKFTPGRSLTWWKQDGQTMGVAICKDMDFINPARRYGQSRVGLMLVPGGDFRVDAFWHGHISVMRGVEDGFSVVRSATRGFLMVADGRGRILAQRSSDSAPFATLLATVPVGHSDTLFLLLGDWFAWVSMALALFVLGQAVRLRRHSADSIR